MRVAVGSDHGGFQLKSEVIACLKDKGIVFQDYGTYAEESVDYPDFAKLVALAVKHGECDLGILCCGTGIGVAIAANKIPGIRAAQCHDTFSARMAREHNHANILTMGQRVIGPGLARDILEAWLAAQEVNGRHARRVDKITELENQTC